MARLPQGVLLAAGGARRYGAPKQLATIGGEPLVRRAARLAFGLPVAGVTVVVGAQGAAVASALRGLPARVLVNPRWRDGMAASIRCAVAALPRNTPAVLLLLADQAALSRPDLARLLARWRARPGEAVAARFGGVLGPPCVLPARLFPALARLRGDAGARALLRLPGRQAIGVDLPGAAVDIDRPADLAAAAGGAV